MERVSLTLNQSGIRYDSQENSHSTLRFGDMVVILQEVNGRGRFTLKKDDGTEVNINMPENSDFGIEVRTVPRFSKPEAVLKGTVKCE